MNEQELKELVKRIQDVVHSADYAATMYLDETNEPETRGDAFEYLIRKLDKLAELKQELDRLV